MNKIKLRRIRRLLSTNKFKLIMFAMVSLFLFTSTGYAILNVVQRIDGTATIWVDSEFVCQSGISAKYQFNSSWGESNGKTHYNTSIVINNNSSEDIATWEIVLKGPSDIDVQTNANIEISDNGVVTLTPLSWNSLINAGNSLTLEIGFITVEENFDPEYIYVNGCLVYGVGSGGSEPDDGEDDNGDSSVELTNLEISPLTYTMAIGETVPLQVTKTPTDAYASLVWSSSDDNIATVSNSGVVTAVSQGEVVITVSSGEISAQSTIIVEEISTPPETTLTNLVLNPTEQNLIVGETSQLIVTMSPADATATLVWSSSDETIAKVGQDGVVVAIGPGEATITVTSGEISAQSKIIVEKAEILLTSLQISPTSHTMNIGDTVTLAVTKSPADATDELTWSSSDETIATVSDSGVVTAISKGDVVITLTNGTISAQSTITIEEPTTELTALSITPSSYTMTVDEKVVLQVTKTPSNSLATLTWSSSNESVATVAQDGTVTAVGVGNTIITVTNGEVSAQSTITVEEAVPPSEVDDVSVKFNLSGNPWGSLEYGYTANFTIDITNNSDTDVNSILFTLDFPEGTTLSIWNAGVTISGTEITYTATLASDGSVKLQGQLALPANYEINDYSSPTITINEVK